MKEKSKQKILVVAIILMAMAGLMTINSKRTLGKLQQDLDRERYQRLVAEENFHKAATKINSLESELAAIRDKIQSAQVILEEGQKTNADLQSQLEAITKAKETLEKRMEELKTASSSKGSPAQQP